MASRSRTIPTMPIRTRRITPRTANWKISIGCQKRKTVRQSRFRRFGNFVECHWLGLARSSRQCRWSRRASTMPVTSMETHPVSTEAEHLLNRRLVWSAGSSGFVRPQHSPSTALVGPQPWGTHWSSQFSRRLACTAQVESSDHGFRSNPIGNTTGFSRKYSNFDAIWSEPVGFRRNPRCRKPIGVRRKISYKIR